MDSPTTHPPTYLLPCMPHDKEFMSSYVPILFRTSKEEEDDEEEEEEEEREIVIKVSSQ